MDVKTFRNANKPRGQFRKVLASQAGIHFIFRLVAPMQVRRPIIRQLSQVRNFLQRAGLGLLLFVFLADGVNHHGGVNAGLLGVNFPEWSVAFDALVE